MANVNISDLGDAGALAAGDLFEVMQSGVNKKMTGAQLAAGAAGSGATVNAVNVFTKNQSVAPVALSNAASIPVNAALSNNFVVTLITNSTLANPTNLTDGMVLNFVIKQDGTGNRTLAYGTAFDFGAAGAPLLSTGPLKVDFISGYYDAASGKILSSFRKSA